jgi:saccharopine dehydrogenase (NAD+, L-lysine-forming)
VGPPVLLLQKKGEKLGYLQPFENDGIMVASIRQLLGGNRKGARALVIGALGRCRRGTVDLFRKISLEELVPLILYSKLTN